MEKKIKPRLFFINNREVLGVGIRTALIWAEVILFLLFCSFHVGKEMDKTNEGSVFLFKLPTVLMVIRQPRSLRQLYSVVECVCSRSGLGFLLGHNRALCFLKNGQVRRCAKWYTLFEQGWMRQNISDKDVSIWCWLFCFGKPLGINLFIKFGKFQQPKKSLSCGCIDAFFFLNEKISRAWIFSTWVWDNSELLCVHIWHSWVLKGG